MEIISFQLRNNWIQVKSWSFPVKREEERDGERAAADDYPRWRADDVRLIVNNDDVKSAKSFQSTRLPNEESEKSVKKKKKKKIYLKKKKKNAQK